MPTFTTEHTSYDRDRANALRDRSDEQVLADARRHAPLRLKGTPVTPDEVILKTERDNEREWRMVHTQRAAEQAIALTWGKAMKSLRESGGFEADLQPDEVSVTVTVKDLIATATITIPAPATATEETR